MLFVEGGEERKRQQRREGMREAGRREIGRALEKAGMSIVSEGAVT